MSFGAVVMFRLLCCQGNVSVLSSVNAKCLSVSPDISNVEYIPIFSSRVPAEVYLVIDESRILQHPHE